MSIKKFTQILFPTTERKRLISLANAAFKDIEEHVLPSLQINDKSYGGIVSYKRLNVELNSRTLDLDKFKGEPIRFIRNTVIRLLDQKEKILSLIEKSFKRDVHIEAIDYSRLQLIQYISGLVYFAEYTTRLMYSMTSAAVGDAYRNIPLESEYMDYVTDRKNMEAYAVVLKSLTYKAQQLGIAIDAVKDISFSEVSHDAMVRVHGNKLEGFTANLMPVVGDLAIIFGEFWNSFLDFRSKLAKEQLEATKLQVLYLDRSKANANPEELASIGKQITYHQKRTAVLEERIKDLKDA